MLQNRKTLVGIFFFLIHLIGNDSLYAQSNYIQNKFENLQGFDNQTLHYGYFFGFSSFGYEFDYSENYFSVLSLSNIDVQKNIGFNVGLIGDLRIHKYINLRLEPGLYSSQRNLLYPIQPGILSSQTRREVKSTYIHIPLLIKLSADRINNWKPYAVGGVSTSFNLSSNEKNLDDNSSGVFRVKTQTLNYEIGLGVDFYLPYFKFSPSIRGIFSLQNELIPDSSVSSPWTSNITSLVNRGLVLNLTFE